MSRTTAPSLAPAVTAAVARQFEGGPTGGLPTVGVELELIPFRSLRPGDRRPRPDIPALAETARALGDLPHVSFEPGGQFELNAPPSASAAGAIAAVTALADRAARRLRRHGMGCLAAGVEPWHGAGDVPLQLLSERYVAMDAHYARCGTAGRVFMRQTASTQVCIGLRPGGAGADQWRAANLLAPLLAAAFANAPRRENGEVGHNGSRTEICRAADPARHHGVCADEHAATAYGRFALGAAPLGPRYAGLDGLEQHLTTLFPPVRPRRTYLEIRSIDALRGDDLASAVVLTAALLATPRAVLAASDRLTSGRLDPSDRWELACGLGVRAPELAAEVVAVVDVALCGVDGLVRTGYLPANAGDLLHRLRARVLDDRAPGDGVA